MCERERIIAVDFDGCLCENAWPDIGEARQDVIDALLSRQKTGAKIILWTCRVGERLDAAVRWCAEHGIAFDAVNENLPVNIAAFGNDCRKIFADEYWDDKAVNPEICDVSIPSGNIDNPPMLNICRNEEMAKLISEEWIASMRNIEPILPNERSMEKYGSMTIKHPWFSATRAVLDYFNKCTEHEKRVRIVIDYDPQSVNTKITYYRDTE